MAEGSDASLAAAYKTPVYDIEEACAEAVTWLLTLRRNGPDLTKNAALKAQIEAHEFAAHPSLEEAADVLICLVAWCVGEGHPVAALSDAVSRKVSVNAARTWAQQADGTWQHEAGGRAS